MSVSRDLVGYGAQGFDPKWPGGKKLALQFVLNYEEGGENCILNGDAASEHLLSDIVGAVPYVGQRHMNMESLYEYGSRAGFWRLHRAFTERNMPLTVYAVGLALEKNPEFDPKWPGGKKLALQFVLNYEEGGENCILNGDAASEHLLSDIVGAVPYVGQRHMNMESLYEYGSRSGFWRLHRAFTERNMPLTVYAVGLALEKNPEAAKAMKDAGWEVASHGYRWIDYQNVDEATEREHIRKTVAIHEKLLGERPMHTMTIFPTGTCSSDVRIL
ncbi:Glycoside hydrolase/deacetylase [Phytophthora palmivora]|uniref:Glycoside hydrolase/deacetylase n=1 Tax=Phytophthora palmivora TaxID=4796 RepID=A0A2P4WWI6_9STRA|nr:Glycoside hydrolase/deacetylase [Phytophthora palmivora]